MVRFNIKTVSNLFRMGHCAPTVMFTVQQSIGSKDDRLVKPTSGMLRGIVNLGSECGGITSPIMPI
jgi:hypothetical protein